MLRSGSRDRGATPCSAQGHAAEEHAATTQATSPDTVKRAFLDPAFHVSTAQGQTGVGQAYDSRHAHSGAGAHKDVTCHI